MYAQIQICYAMLSENNAYSIAAIHRSTIFKIFFFLELAVHFLLSCVVVKLVYVYMVTKCLDSDVVVKLGAYMYAG